MSRGTEDGQQFTEEWTPRAIHSTETGLQLVAANRELIDLSDDAVLLGKGQSADTRRRQNGLARPRHRSAEGRTLTSFRGI